MTAALPRTRNGRERALPLQSSYLMDSERFKLLVLTPAFPYPPVSGGDIRIFHLLRRLSSTFSVHLFPYTGGSSERLIAETGISAVHAPDPEAGRVRSRHPRQWIKFWRHAPHGLNLDVDPAYAQTLRRVVATMGFHGVLIDHLYMMQ